MQQNKIESNKKINKTQNNLNFTFIFSRLPLHHKHINMLISNDGGKMYIYI